MRPGVFAVGMPTRALGRQSLVLAELLKVSATSATGGSNRSIFEHMVDQLGKTHTVSPRITPPLAVKETPYEKDCAFAGRNPASNLCDVHRFFG